MQAKRHTAAVLSELFEMAAVSCRGQMALLQSFPFKDCLDNPAFIWHFQTSRLDRDDATLGLLTNKVSSYLVEAIV